MTIRTAAALTAVVLLLGLTATAGEAQQPAAAEAQPPAAEAPKAPPKPCDTEEHRQFDFWVGDWEVSQADGTVAGTNLIEKILGDCVLKESWVGTGGLHGESFNMYSGTRGWHQTWVDSSGQLLRLDGGLRDGKMVLEGEAAGKNGGKALHRITWTPLEDGRVKQHWQVSRDAGKTWNDAFVGFYARKKK